MSRRSARRAAIDVEALREELEAGVQAARREELHNYAAGDEAVMSMLSGATFGPGASVILPSGKRMTGTEMTAAIGMTLQGTCARCNAGEVFARGLCADCYEFLRRNR